MFQIGDDIIVSLDVIEQQFSCYLTECRGHCCVYGDSGAPLEEKEIENIKNNILSIIPFMQNQGVDVVEKTGYAIKDEDNEWVTPLINNNECAYSYFENGIAKCAIEKAFKKGKIKFRKPISCWLYPIRIKKYDTFIAVTLHNWSICKSGYLMGKQIGIKVYEFLKEPLIQKFGKLWYYELTTIAKEWENKKNNFAVKKFNS